MRLKDGTRYSGVGFIPISLQRQDMKKIELPQTNEFGVTVKSRTTYISRQGNKLAGYVAVCPVCGNEWVTNAQTWRQRKMCLKCASKKAAEVIRKDVPKYIRTTLNGMRNRCYNKNNPGYDNYGGRGIRICDRWMDQKMGPIYLYEDLGDRPDGYSIDRIDNDGDYTPENCKWSSKQEQRLNQRDRKRTGCVIKEKTGYRAEIGFNNTKAYLGTYSTEADAYSALNAAKDIISILTKGDTNGEYKEITRYRMEACDSHIQGP